MNNHYNPSKIFKDAWNHTKYFMVIGVTSKSLHGITICILKDQLVTPITVARACATAKAAVLKNEPECKVLIYVSVYDRKCVHFLCMISELLGWTKKYHMFYCNAKNNIAWLELFRLNINYDYNLSMWDVDAADQFWNKC